MKTSHKAFSFAMLLLFGAFLVKGYTENEAATTDGNFTAGTLGVARVSTAPAVIAPTFETRHLSVAEDGSLLVFQGTSKSSFTSATQHSSTKAITSLSSASAENRNVYDLAFPSAPIFLSKIVFPEDTGIVTTMQVFDCRGNTMTPAVPTLLYKGVVTATGTKEITFNHWLSSGLYVACDGPMPRMVLWERTQRVK